VKEFNLFMIPYAGGSSSVYRKWKKDFSKNINVVFLELSGRGSRYREPLYLHLKDTVDDIYNQILDVTTHSRKGYAFFGHSMGALIAYELAYKIQESSIQNPDYLFISGHMPPHLRKQTDRYKMPDNKFLKEIIKLGGSSKALLESTELADIILPILKADMQSVETYEHYQRPKKLNIDMHIFNGEKDITTINHLIKEWSIFTERNCYVNHFKGNHFFIDDNYKEITRIINQVMIG